MGNHSAKKSAKKSKKNKLKYKFITDKFTSYSQLEQALRDVGVEATELIVGVDFTKSNTWQGGRPFYPKENLHSMLPYPNPYQQVLSIIAKSLAPFDSDQLIPTYGFGDDQFFITKYL